MDRSRCSWSFSQFGLFRLWIALECSMNSQGDSMIDVRFCNTEICCPILEIWNLSLILRFCQNGAGPGLAAANQIIWGRSETFKIRKTRRDGWTRRFKQAVASGRPQVELSLSVKDSSLSAKDAAVQVQVGSGLTQNFREGMRSTPTKSERFNYGIGSVFKM